RTFLPDSDSHQQILDVVHTSDPSFRFSEETVDLHRVGTWFGTEVPDSTEFSCSFSVRTVGRQYEFGPDLQVPPSVPESMEPFLQPEDAIQVDDPEIQATLAEIGA